MRQAEQRRLDEDDRPHLAAQAAEPRQAIHQITAPEQFLAEPGGEERDQRDLGGR